MDVDPPSTSSAPKPVTQDPVPEGEVYLRLLIVHHFLASPSIYDKAGELVHETVDKMQAWNRRSMDPVAAEVWYAVERAYELGDELANARP